MVYAAESFEPEFASVMGSADPERLRARIDKIMFKRLTKRHAETSPAAQNAFANAVPNASMKPAQFHSDATVSAGDAVSKSTPNADATLTAMTSEQYDISSDNLNGFGRLDERDPHAANAANVTIDAASERGSYRSRQR